MEWIAKLLHNRVAQSPVRTYFDVLNMIFNAAVVDRVIADNPCKAIRISAVLRGLSHAPKWVPTTDDVLALVQVVPPEFQAAIWLGAGQGLRLGEVHVVQQLRFYKEIYGGFHLAPPKSGSVGDVDLDDQVAAAIAENVDRYPPVKVWLPDITRGTPDPGKEPRRRSVALLFTDDNERPIHDQRWSILWKRWRKDAG